MFIDDYSKIEIQTKAEAAIIKALSGPDLIVSHRVDDLIFYVDVHRTVFFIFNSALEEIISKNLNLFKKSIFLPDVFKQMTSACVALSFSKGGVHTVMVCHMI